MSGYRPEFDRDYSFGRQGEILIENALAWVAAGDARVETKRSRFRDTTIFVEMEQKPRHKDWQPSGLNVTTAEYWFYVKPGGLIYGIPTDTLRAEAGRQLARGTRLTPGGMDGDNPTRGLLMSLKTLQALNI